MKRVAVLDKHGILVGARVLEDDAELRDDEIDKDPGDLSLDGLYKWMKNDESFTPLGHGFGKPKVGAPASGERALFSMIRFLEDKFGRSKLPGDALLWADWWGDTMDGRDAEILLRRKRRGGDR